jgi:uncharacterized membrane protein
LGVFQISLILSAFLCSIVAGFLFAFAVVVMPGIRNLNDREFICTFQAIDHVIQNNQPVFMLVWGGSVLFLIIALVLSFVQPDGAGNLLLILAAIVYLIGVQLPTVIINIPLNNRLQTFNVEALNESEQKSVRADFEPRWNRWNSIRTVLSCLASALLIVQLFRL